MNPLDRFGQQMRHVMADQLKTMFEAARKKAAP